MTDNASTTDNDWPVRRKRSRLAVLALPLVSVAVLLGGALPADAATGPDGFPILHASAGNLVHHCEVLGTDQNAVQAVVCVDLTTSLINGGYQVEGAVEGYCQNSFAATLVACDTVQLDVGLANGGEEYETGASCSGECQAKRYSWSPLPFQYSDDDCTSSPLNDVWDLALGSGAFGGTLITTPGGKTYTVSANGANDGGNYSTGHYWICP